MVSIKENCICLLVMFLFHDVNCFYELNKQIILLLKNEGNVNKIGKANRFPQDGVACDLTSFY